MASREKDPAVLRTLSLFSGKTALEEAQALASGADTSDADHETSQRTGHPLEMIHEAELTAVRWLGLDAFHEGDDVKVAVHRAGHAVLVLVRTEGAKGMPYGTATIKLSKTQWSKLKDLAKEAG